MKKMLPPFLAPVLQNFRLSKPWRDWISWLYDTIGVLEASAGSGLISDTAYDATTWNGVTTIAPSKNAVRDKLESLVIPVVAGSDTQIQYNNSGALGADADFTWNATTNILGLTGGITFGQNTTNLTNSIASTDTNIAILPSGSATASRVVLCTQTTRTAAHELQLGVDTAGSTGWLWQRHTTNAAPLNFNFYVGSGSVPQVQIPNTISTPVNYLTLQGSTTGNDVTVGSSGSDSNIPIRLSPKGSTGAVRVVNSGNAGIIKVGATTTSTESCSIEVGEARSGNGFSYIDLIGDATYTDFGLRMIRNSGGPNTESIIQHRGTGPLRLLPQEGTVEVYAENSLQFQVIAPTSTAAINYITVRGSATNTPCRIATAGTNTDIDLLINPKGAGNIVVPKTSGFGIKVDPTTPTYGWADMIGNVYIKTTGTGSPLLASYAGSGTIQQFQFALNDVAYFEFHIPHDYVPGTDIYAHVHWSCNTSTITTGSVTWEFSTSYAKGHDQAAFAVPLVTTIAQNASTVQRRHMIAETVITTSGGSATLHDTSLIEVDGLFLMRLKLTANSISAATDPFVHFVDLHYQTTGVMGTKQKAPNFYT